MMTNVPGGMMKTFEEIKSEVLEQSLLTGEDGLNIYRSSNLKIQEIENSIYEASLLQNIIMRLESMNNEDSYNDFISQKSLQELRKKFSFWNNEMNKLIVKYDKVIIEKLQSDLENIEW